MVHQTRNSATDKDEVTILVTGANSGLGFSVCCRLIDEFLYTRPKSQTLHLIYTTRDPKKRSDTLKRLNTHLARTLEAINGSKDQSTKKTSARIRLEGVLVDVTRLLSLKALAEEFLENGQHFDAVIWNAGITGWLGQNWPKAIYHVLTSIIHNTTYPRFAKAEAGAIAAHQLPAYEGNEAPKNEPILGQVFLSNVFGHYMLTHWLSPLFTPSTRIIWVGSISTIAHDLEMNDLQGLRSITAYEGSKRVTELFTLTSELPSTKPYVDSFLPGKGPKPKMYLTHPGVISTSIAALNWFMNMLMDAVFYIARWLGSPWHCVDPYKGAISAAFCALAPTDQLEDFETKEGKGKWGSAVTVFGDERVARSDTDGWGYCGKVGVVPKGSVTTNKHRSNKPVTTEARQAFEEDGRRVWQELEQMRMEWEAILDEYEQREEDGSDAE